MKKLSLIMICNVIMSLPALADDNANPQTSFWGEHAQGWHWYEDPAEDQNSEQALSQADPVQVMDALQKAVKQKLDRAILNPSQENMRDYIALQNQVSDKASQFAKAWRSTLLSYPGLDFNLTHPASAVGKEVYTTEQRAAEDKVIHDWAQHTGLFFFYRSSCPYCQRFAPILKDFVGRYGISVVPVTTDGISLPDFPDSHVDQGQAARFNVTVEPALFTVNPYTQQIVPVAYGLMAEDELKQRILTIVNQPASEEVSP